MALVIEDGTIVAGANSYVTDAEFTAFADARGASYPSTAGEREILLIQAVDYLEGLRARYKGQKVDSSQSLQWPREDVYVDGFEVAENVIPTALKNAQIQLALEANQQDLAPTGTGKEVVKERVEGAVDVQYAETGNTSPQPQMKKVERWLAPLLRNGFGLRNTRV